MQHAFKMCRDNTDYSDTPKSINPAEVVHGE